MDDRKTVETLIDYTFKNGRYYEEAMTAAGANSSSEAPAEQNGNKRLALVGDALIRLLILDDWYQEGTSTGR